MRKKYYLTKEGLKRLKKELKELKRLRKVKMKEEVPSYTHSDDLNVEYLSYWEDMNFLERRILEIEEILDHYELIKEPKDKNVVQIGATVWIEINGREDKFQIVGSIEADPSRGKISNESPVGKALLGKKVGDKVLISNLNSEITYKIKKIEYHLD